MMKKGKKIILAIVITLTVAVLVLDFLTRLVSPKYSEHLVEGSMIQQYYSEDRYHDVIFVGDCEAYANFSPMVMWEKYGITAYVRGGSQQQIWQSYYILKETFKYEVPKTVVLSISSLRYSEPVKEEYNRLLIDKMRWSKEKIGIIKASMTEDESFVSYLFPIIRYHSRITELSDEDFRYLFKTKDHTFNGYLLEKETVPYTGWPEKRARDEYLFSDVCMEWLDRIRILCDENGTELIFIKAPSLYPHWYDLFEKQIVDYSGRYGISYYNLYEKREEIGIDYSSDTYDGGMHLNIFGAEKLSDYFGKILSENENIPDRRNDGKVSELYNQKLVAYKAAKDGN